METESSNIVELSSGCPISHLHCLCHHSLEDLSSDPKSLDATFQTLSWTTRGLETAIVAPGVVHFLDINQNNGYNNGKPPADNVDKLDLEVSLARLIAQLKSVLPKQTNVRYISKKTLPEAQRTQGIESLTWIIFFTISNLYPF